MASIRIVNMLTVDDGCEEEFWKYRGNWGKVCCFNLQPQNLWFATRWKLVA